MSNMRILITQADSATLSVSPAVVATLPASNLQLPERALVMRTTSTANQQISGTWAAGKLLSGLELDRHNLTSAGTWRLRLYSDAAWTTLVYDSGALLVNPPKSLGELVWGVDPLGAGVFDGWALAFASMWFTPVVAQSFRIDLADAANPDGYLEVCRLMLGHTIEPTWNFEWQPRLAWSESTKQTRTDGGTLRSEAFQPYRSGSVTLPWLTSGDRARFLDLYRTLGRRGDFFVSLYPEQGGMLERDNAMRAKFTGGGEIVHGTAHYFGQTLQFEEA